MKTLFISIFVCCSLALFAQSVSLAELEQSRLMSRDSFVAYYTPKGFISSKDDSTEAYQKRILPFSMHCWQSKEAISIDTIEGGIMVIRYFCEDTNSVSFFENQLSFYNIVEQSTDSRYSYQNFKKIYLKDSIRIVFNMIDGYSQLIIVPTDDLGSSNINKTNRTDGDTSAIKSHSGSGSGRCSDGGGLGYNKKMNGSGYRIANRIAIEIPKPAILNDLEGVVVVTIWVDRLGKVVKSQAGAIGTTISNQELFIECEKKAVEAKFTECIDCPEPQKGTITYFFVKLK